MRLIAGSLLFFLVAASGFAQESRSQNRGSIPGELLRPNWAERPRYPVDTVIGELGQGTASDAAFSFANWIAGGFLSGQMGHPALASVNPVLRESYISTLKGVEPRFYRIGGGREEPDGAVSFLIRFVGREVSITGEMYIRHVTILVEEESAEEGQAAEPVTRANWVLEDLLFDVPRSREEEQRESSHRLDYTPYERFY